MYCRFLNLELCRMGSYQHNFSAMMDEFLLILPHGERGYFLWLAGVCVILWVLWGEQSSRIFRGVDKDLVSFGPLSGFMFLCGFRF